VFIFNVKFMSAWYATLSKSAGRGPNQRFISVRNAAMEVAAHVYPTA
jgi:hypothetical protein